MTISQNGISILKDLEDLRLNAYPDGGKYSIGYGHQIQPNESYLITQRITEAQAEQLLKKDLLRFETYVRQFQQYIDTQFQFDALVIFAYNVGSFGTDFQKYLKSKNWLELENTWRKYNKSNGVVLSALNNRRNLEISLFQSGSIPINKGFLALAVAIGAYLFLT